MTSDSLGDFDRFYEVVADHSHLTDEATRIMAGIVSGYVDRIP